MTNLKANYEEIVNVANIGTFNSYPRLQDNETDELSRVAQLGMKEELSPAVTDIKKVLLVCIDLQNDFMEGGTLAVPGSCKDMETLTRFMHQNVDKITNLLLTMDTHYVNQIFFPGWWMDEYGNHPNPGTIITVADTKGKWKPIFYPLESLNYVEKLEAAGKDPLCIWPLHCQLGTPGFALESEFCKMKAYMEAARKMTPHIVLKGNNPLSEAYGFLKNEFAPENTINPVFTKCAEEYDLILVAGQAKSHCVLVSELQMVEYYANRPDILKKFIFLEDCTSCIPGYEDKTEKTLDMMRKNYGIRVEKSTDIVL